MTIAAADIAVVIQGPMRPEVEQNVAAIRDLLPGAEIVLSTWANVQPKVVVDRLVQSLDPGPTQWLDNENTSRQIVSTRNGLLTATRRYAVKMRSDSVLTSDGFRHMDAEAVPRGAPYALFQRRIVSPTLFTRNPAKWPLLFHPSDMFHFGLRSDLLRLWSVPPVQRYLVNGELHVNAPSYLVPEQYLFRNFLQGQGIALPPAFREDDTPEHIAMSNGYLTQNFWVETEERLGVSYPARSAQPWYRPESIFTPEEWWAVAETYSREPATAA